jgi:hypothetical protein
MPVAMCLMRHREVWRTTATGPDSPGGADGQVRLRSGQGTVGQPLVS